MKKTLAEKYTEIRKLLEVENFQEVFCNHPSSQIREYHWIKDQVRLAFYFRDNAETYYCTIAQLQPQGMWFSVKSINYFDLSKAVTFHTKSVEFINQLKTIRHED
jgi:hypothetical protein